jgi:hypothetical protein
VQGGADLTFPSRCKGGFIVPRRPFAGGCAQYPGKSDGTEATSFFLSSSATRRSVRSLLAGFDSSGSRCTTPAG